MTTKDKAVHYIAAFCAIILFWVIVLNLSSAVTQKECVERLVGKTPTADILILCNLRR